MGKRPSIQFYPADWRKDAALQSCSLEAQGLWINLICIAHECEPYGYLSINGSPMTTKMIARLIGISETKTKRILAELEANFVLSREQNCIFSRRMVRDKQAYDAYLQAQSEHGLKGKEHGKKGGRPKAENNGVAGSDPVSDPVILKPGDNPSSSSSSSSTSVNTDTPLPPKGGDSDKPPVVEPDPKRTATPKPRWSEADTPIPLLLDTPEFRETWANWIQARDEQKKPVSPTAAKQQFAELTKIGVGNAIECIRHSIMNQYQGLLTDKFKPGLFSARPQQFKTKRELDAEFMAKQMADAFSEGRPQ